MRRGGVTVVGVQQQPVRQALRACARIVLTRRELGRHFLGAVLPAEAKLDDLACRVAPDELQRRSFRRDLALVHHDQPVTELLGLVHVMRRQNQRDPPLLQPEERSQTVWRACGSSPVVGSSSSRTSGSFTSERAIVSRRFIPPERGSTLSFARSVSWTKSISSSARRPARHAAVRSNGRR